MQALPPNAAELVTSQVTASAVMVFILEELKKFKGIPWINQKSDKINRLAAGLLAAGTAVGIHFQYDATAHTLMISGLTVAAVLHGLWHWVNSVAFQELIYRGIVKNGQKANPAA